MRFFFLFLVLLQLSLTQHLSAQSSDTFHHSADSSHNTATQPVKVFHRFNDNEQFERIKNEVAKNGKPLDAFLQQMKERENARKRQVYFRTGLVIAFLLVMVLTFALRRKQKNRA
jgi:hypothetical protein